MTIRPETVGNNAAIARFHGHAFGDRAAEAITASLLRQRPLFGPDLALVYEDGGRVVGRALFSPQVVHLPGERVWAVNLAPIAVEPGRRGRGLAPNPFDAYYPSVQAGERVPGRVIWPVEFDLT